MANDYCTAGEIKDALPDGNWGASYDALLIALATRASRAIDRYTGRKPGAYSVTADVTLYYDGSGETLQRIGEIATAPTSVAVAESGTSTYTPWSVTDYLLQPVNAPDSLEPYTALQIDRINGSKTVWYAYPKSVKIVGKSGYSIAVPDEVKQCTIIQATRWFKRGQQAFQDVAATAALGQQQFSGRIDADIAELLRHLRRVAL